MVTSRTALKQIFNKIILILSRSFPGLFVQWFPTYVLLPLSDPNTWFMITLMKLSEHKEKKRIYVTFAKEKKKCINAMITNVNSYVYNLHNLEMFLVLFGK